MTLRVSAKVTHRGPVFDRRAERIIDRFETQLRSDVADRGAEEVGRETIVFKHPTGNYLRRITTQTRAREHAVLLDDVAYRLWIEGTDRRNQTTRFKGYKVFRQARDALDNRVDEIARSTIRPFLRELN